MWTGRRSRWFHTVRLLARALRPCPTARSSSSSTPHYVRLSTFRMVDFVLETCRAPRIGARLPVENTASLPSSTTSPISRAVASHGTRTDQL